MKQEKDQKARIRKAYSHKEGVTQKMMTFRADYDVIEILQSVVNKGRLINDLVRAWATSHNADERKKDDDPTSHTGEDIEP